MSVPDGIHVDYQEPAAGIALIIVGGELDLYSLDEFKSALSTAEHSDRELMILDLRELTFIDSSGLGAIIGVQGRALKSERRLVVCPSEIVSKTFEITGLHRVLATAATPEELLSSPE
jgi:anti-sigma B factor antagonist